MFFSHTCQLCGHKTKKWSHKPEFCEGCYAPFNDEMTLSKGFSHVSDPDAILYNDNERFSNYHGKINFTSIKLPDHELINGLIQYIIISPDSSKVLVVHGHILTVWDIKTHRLLERLNVEHTSLVSIGPDGKCNKRIDMDALELRNPQVQEGFQVLHGNKFGWVRCVKHTDDFRYVLFVRYYPELGECISLYDTVEWIELGTTHAFNDWSYRSQFDINNATVFFGSNNGILKIMDFNRNTLKTIDTAYCYYDARGHLPITSVSYWSYSLTVGLENGDIEKYCPSTGEPIGHYSKGSWEHSGLSVIAFATTRDPRKRFLISGHYGVNSQGENELKVYDSLRGGIYDYEVKVFRRSISLISNCISVSPDNKYIICGYEGGSLGIWYYPILSDMTDGAVAMQRLFRGSQTRASGEGMDVQNAINRRRAAVTIQRVIRGGQVRNSADTAVLRDRLETFRNAREAVSALRIQRVYNKFNEQKSKHFKQNKAKILDQLANEDCLICMEKLLFSENAQDGFKVFNCLHIFHQKCAEQWRLSAQGEGSNKCPTCREINFNTIILKQNDPLIIEVKSHVGAANFQRIFRGWNIRGSNTLQLVTALKRNCHFCSMSLLPRLYQNKLILYSCGHIFHVDCWNDKCTPESNCPLCNAKYESSRILEEDDPAIVEARTKKKKR